MSDEQVSLRQMLERREREFMMGMTRTRMRSTVENLDVGDFHIDHLGEGESTELPRWVADELVASGVAETAETPFENEVFGALSREKMMGPLQLSGLTPDFYVKMRRRLGVLGSGVAEGKAKSQDYERLRAVCYDLVGIRLSKLLSLSSSLTPATSLAEKLTPEEAEFFAVSQSLSKEWKAGLLGSGR